MSRSGWGACYSCLEMVVYLTILALWACMVAHFRKLRLVGLGACPGASTPISFIDPRGAPPVNDAWQHQA